MLIIPYFMPRSGYKAIFIDTYILETQYFMVFNINL